MMVMIVMMMIMIIIMIIIMIMMIIGLTHTPTTYVFFWGLSLFRDFVADGDPVTS